MKELIFGLIWVAPGVFLAATRSRRPVAERVLSLLFWPFFVAMGEERAGEGSWAPPAGPLSRLHQALGADDSATTVVLDLHQAVGRLEARLDRMTRALAQVDAVVADEGRRPVEV